MAPTLGYWNIRGLAQPIRLLLNYAEVEFEDKKYAYGPSPTFDRSAWLTVKPTLGLDFPNLPYYIDDDVKLTQSISILRYLASKHKLDGETDAEKRRIDMAEQQIVDIRSAFTSICYSEDYEKKKVELKKTLPNSLKLISKFLGDYAWIAGEKLTYVDFMLYEVLDQLKLFDADSQKDLKNLNDYTARFEKLPTIESYMKSENFMKFPLNGDMAKFGSRSSAK